MADNDSTHGTSMMKYILLTILLSLTFLFIYCSHWQTFSQKLKSFIRISSPHNTGFESNTWYYIPHDVDPRKYHPVVGVTAAYFHPKAEHLIIMGLSKASSYLNKNTTHKWPVHLCYFYDVNKKYVYATGADFSIPYMIKCNCTGGYYKSHYVFLYFDNGPDFEPLVDPPFWLLEVQHLARRQLRGELGVCTGLMFKEQNFLLLLQFFEFYILHGASKFYLHRFDLGKLSYFKVLLQYYRKKGLAEVKPFEPDFLFCSYKRRNKNHPYCGQSMMDNNCILHSAYYYRYVVLCDFDELMQPTSQIESLLHWVRRSFERPSIGSLQIMPRYHVTRSKLVTFQMLCIGVMKACPNLRNHLPIMTWNNVSRPIKHLHYAPKVIVRPETIARVVVHSVWAYYGNYSNKKVDPYNGAFFHHYKNFSEMKAYWIDYIPSRLYKVLPPTSMLSEEFLDELIFRIDQVIWDIRAENSSVFDI